MKRFVTASVLLLALALGVYWAVYYNGFYLPSGEERSAVKPPFRTEGKKLCRWDGQKYTDDRCILKEKTACGYGKTIGT